MGDMKNKMWKMQEDITSNAKDASDKVIIST